MLDQQTYTLSWIMPFARQSLKGKGNFGFKHFANDLFEIMLQANVSGIERSQLGASLGERFQYDEIPLIIRQLVTEVFFHILHKGYAVPDPPDRHLNSPQMVRFNMTERGLIWANGEEPLPEDASRYMKFLRERVVNLDPIIEQYVIEALTAFERDSFFAAAVMLGAASEKALYLLAESLSLSFKEARKREKLDSLMVRRKLFDLLETIRRTILETTKAEVIPYKVSEGADSHLMSLCEAIRVQRNDAVHPMNATVSEASVRLLLHSFPYALSKSEELRAWLVAHPGSI